MTDHRLPVRLDRRALFGLSGVTAATLVSGTAEAAPSCVDPATLPLQSSINGARSYYEISGQPSSARYNRAFFDRVVAWSKFWDANTPYPKMTVLRNYGAYVNRNDGCTSMHNYGRAFDIASGWTGGTRHFTARYDLWKGWSGAELTRVRQQYWAAGASLHLHFEHTLTYLFNAAHHNHFHVDNTRSGTGLSSFSRTGTQVKSVQAMLRYVWGKSVAIDGAYGPATAGAASQVLQRVGRSGSLTSSRANWHAFLTATTRKGTGMQAY